MNNYLVKIYCVRHTPCECMHACQARVRHEYMFSYVRTAENKTIAIRDVKAHFDKTTTGWMETIDKITAEQLEPIHVVDYGRLISTDDKFVG